MVKRGLTYLVILWLALTAPCYAQQGIQFSQYAFTGLTVNPAYAGYKEDWTLNLVSRLQWTGINGAPRTGAISIDGVTDDTYKNVGVGFVAIGDQLGPQTTTSFYGNYAYRIQMNAEDSQRLSLGFGIGVAQYQVDASKFNAADLTDPFLATGTVNKISPDCRIGAFYTSSSFYAGLSGVNLLADADFVDSKSVVRQARAFYLSSGCLLSMGDNLDFKPTLLVKEDFKGPTNIDVSANFLLAQTLWLGTSYRTGVKSFNKSALSSNLSDYDAIAGIVQYYINTRLRIGYSFDYNVGKLTSFQNGSHELSIGITFSRRQEKVLSPRYF